MTTPQTIREIYRLQDTSRTDQPEQIEIRYEVDAAGRHTASLVSTANTVSESGATPETAQTFRRTARNMAIKMGYRLIDRRF
jgi:glucose-6-phosphate isomerase